MACRGACRRIAESVASGGDNYLHEHNTHSAKVSGLRGTSSAVRLVIFDAGNTRTVERLIWTLFVFLGRVSERLTTQRPIFLLPDDFLLPSKRGATWVWRAAGRKGHHHSRCRSLLHASTPRTHRNCLQGPPRAPLVPRTTPTAEEPQTSLPAEEVSPSFPRVCTFMTKP